MKKLLYIILLLFFSGCGFQQRFIKENITQTEYMKDRYDCTFYANDVLESYYRKWILSHTSLISRKRMLEITNFYFVKCMEDRGYKIADEDDGCYYKLYEKGDE